MSWPILTRSLVQSNPFETEMLRRVSVLEQAISDLRTEAEAAHEVVLGLIEDLGNDQRVAHMTLFKTGNQTLANNTTETVTFGDSSETDPENHLTFDNANDTVDINTDGVYLLIGRIDWAADAGATGVRRVRIIQTGTAVAEATVPATGTSSRMAPPAVRIVNASAGATIGMDGLQTSGGNLDVVGGSIQSTHLQVVRLRAT